MDEVTLIKGLSDQGPVVIVLLAGIYWARGELRAARTELAEQDKEHRADRAALEARHREDLAAHVARMDSGFALMLDLVGTNTAALEGIEGSLTHLSDISDIRNLLRGEPGVNNG